MALTETKVLDEETTTVQAAENRIKGTQISQDVAMTDENTTGEQNLEFDGDIDLSAIRKKRFRINGDNNKYIELNTSDMNIITRLDKLYPKLEKLAQDAALKQLDKDNEDDEAILSKISQTLVKIDAQMRQILDDIFDSNVSEACAPDGSMFDPFNGEFRFEHIIDVLTKLYTNNLNVEFRKMSAKMKKHTSKYTKGK